MLRVLSVFLCVFLISCASGPSYQEPDGDKVSLATLQGSKVGEGISTQWAHFSPTKIDGQKPSYKMENVIYRKHLLAPGTHEISVHANYNVGFLKGCPCSAETVLTAEFEAGKSYKIDGNVNRDAVDFWIKDIESNQKISPVVTVRSKATPQVISVPGQGTILY